VRLGSLMTLVGRDLRRTRGVLFVSGFGIAVGTAALVFFLALGLGVRAVLLGEVFPIDQVELEPPRASDPGLLGLLTGGGEPTGIPEADVARLAAAPGAKAVFPKLRFAFPASARGGKEIFGYDVGASEMIGDGIDPALARLDLATPASFVDPMDRPGPPCDDDAGCTAPQYCERPNEPAGEKGRCSDPVPAVISRYVLELFDKSIAPAHNLPPIGETLVRRAEGVSFNLRLGESLLGRAKQGAPRTVRARIVGVSRRAVDLGLTLPLSVVRRWNREYAGAKAADRYSSVVVQVERGGATADIVALGAAMRLEPHDTRARDVSVLVSGVMALLSLVAGIILVMSASNIAHTFRVMVGERRAEIGLYRAVGASSRDVGSWMMALALVVGVAGGAVGLVAARALALATDAVAARKLPDFPFKPDTFFAWPPWLLAGGLGFAAVFAALGAWGPARRAARVQPAAALTGS